MKINQTIKDDMEIFRVFTSGSFSKSIYHQTQTESIIHTDPGV